jgi:hypothetical protein
LLLGAFKLKHSDAILQTTNLSQMLAGVMLKMNFILLSCNATSLLSAQDQCLGCGAAQ